MKFRRSQGFKEHIANDSMPERVPKDPADLILDAIGYIPHLVHTRGKKTMK